MKGQCDHAKITKISAVSFCSLISILFVGALYVLVPKAVRKLDRDHPVHIQRRALSSLVVCYGAVLAYPYLFCDDNTETDGTFSIVQLLFQPRGTIGVLMHTVILYLGPIVACLLRLYEFRSMPIARGKPLQGSYPGQVLRYLKGSLQHLLDPSTEEDKWKNIRNYLLAPWTEEIAFRGCMVPCLLASGMSAPQVSFLAPTFFGFAHVHHASLRLSEGEPLARVLIGTSFQFTYTSLFGAYVSYAFIRSGSVMAVTLSHAYCNWMGLPDLSFLQKASNLYKYRIVLSVAYLIGMIGFWWFFSTGYLLPLPAKLDFTTVH